MTLTFLNLTFVIKQYQLLFLSFGHIWLRTMAAIAISVYLPLNRLYFFLIIYISRCFATFLQWKRNVYKRRVLLNFENKTDSIFIFVFNYNLFRDILTTNKAHSTYNEQLDVLHAVLLRLEGTTKSGSRENVSYNAFIDVEGDHFEHFSKWRTDSNERIS